MEALFGATQLIGFTGQAIQTVAWLRRKFKEIKTAPRVIKNLYRELQAFESTLVQLLSIDQSSISDDAATSFFLTISDCEDVFETLIEELTKLDFESNKDGPKKLWKRIVTNEKRKDLEEHIQRLDRAKASLITTMTGMQLELTRLVIHGICLPL